MLSLMRKHAGNWIIKFILGAVILAFIPFGYGIYQDKRDTEVASVNGEPVYYEEYNQVYNNLIAQMRQNFGDAFNEEMIKTLGLKDRAIEQLIDRKLMLEEAQRLGLMVSDEELAESIRGIEAFQTAGTFDPRRYEFVLERLRINNDQFQASQREDLLINKYRTIMAANAKVSDDEALEWYQWNNASMNVNFVQFSSNRFKDVNPSKDEVRQYFEENKEKYRTEVELKARFVFFDPKADNDDVDVSAEEIKEYYEGNPQEFSTPKTVEARHILFKVAEDADAAAVDQALAKARNVLKLAREGSDFADLAVKYSEGPSANNGGYLGAFRKESMVKPFADKAFSMQAGDISDPVRTRFGWHIIKVEKVNEASTLQFDQAKEGIRKKLLEEKSKSRALETAEQIYDTSFEGDDLLRNAEDAGLSVVETDFFTRKGPEGVVNRTQFASTAFDLEMSEISEIQDVNTGYYLIQVIDKKPSRIPDFEEVAAKVRQDVIKEQQVEMAGKEAEAFLADVKGGDSLASAAQKFGVKVEDTGFFKRNAPIPKIGFDQELMQEAFSLTPADPFPEKAYKVDRSYYVVEFKARKEPPPQEFEKEKQVVMQQLLQQKQFTLLADVLADKKSGSDIQINMNLQQ